MDQLAQVQRAQVSARTGVTFPPVTRHPRRVSFLAHAPSHVVGHQLLGEVCSISCCAPHMSTSSTSPGFLHPPASLRMGCGYVTGAAHRTRVFLGERPVYYYEMFLSISSSYREVFKEKSIINRPSLNIFNRKVKSDAHPCSSIETMTRK